MFLSPWGVLGTAVVPAVASVSQSNRVPSLLELQWMQWEEGWNLLLVPCRYSWQPRRAERSPRSSTGSQRLGSHLRLPLGPWRTVRLNSSALTYLGSHLCVCVCVSYQFYFSREPRLNTGPQNPKYACHDLSFQTLWNLVWGWKKMVSVKWFILQLHSYRDMT